MSNDHQLAIRLAADASELKRAQAEGAAGFDKLAAAGQDANKTLSAAAQAEAAARRASSDALRVEQEAVRKARVERNLLAQANRQLAMNMTDVVTSVATGMPVWMVAIQQGGQIRDAYGGIVPAGRAVLGLMTPLAVGIGATAVAMASAVLAYNQGASEMQAYGRALAMTNNAAGTTRNELAGIAREMAATRGTQAQAAEALALAAGAGIASQNLRMVADAAVNLQRVGGPAIADTVAQFAELGRSPTAASVKLNSEIHHLTATTYDHIKALEKQGQFAQAAAVAQEEYAKATKRQTAELELQLGSIERMWMRAGEEAARAWDRFRGLGRPDTLADQIKQAEAEVENARRRGGEAAQYNAATGRMMPGGADQLAAAEARLATLRMQLYMQGEAAAADQAAADAADKHIREAGQRDAEAKAMNAARLQAVKDGLQAQVAAYAQAGQLLQTYNSANLLTEESFYAARRALIEADARARVTALEAENALLLAQPAYGPDAIARDAAVAHNRREMAAITAKAAAEVGQANVQERLSLEALRRAQVEYEFTLERAAAQRASGNSRTLTGMRMGDAQRDRTGRLDAINERFDSDVDRLNSDRFNNRIGDAAYRERLASLQTFHQQALREEAAYQQARRELESDTGVGLDRALANYAEGARNAAQTSERAWTSAFQSMEDGIVRFAMTGKLSFNDLVGSVVAGMIRMQLQAQLSGLFSTGLNMLTSFMGGGSVTGATGDFARMDRAVVLHGGGVVGREEPAAWRTMPASTWDRAPRFHSGRLAGNEMAAILQKDESVLTPGQMRQLAPAGRSTQIALSLNVINNTGTPVQATARQRGDGGIDLLLDAARQAVAGDIASGQGAVTEALQGRYNLRPAMA